MKTCVRLLCLLAAFLLLHSHPGYAKPMFTGLGDLPGGDFRSRAQSVFADGSTVVGWGDNAPGDTAYVYEAFIWDATNGMRELDQVLIDLGLDLTGWMRKDADDISANGRVIVGTGINPSGDMEAWIAVLSDPEPVPTARPGSTPGP